MPSSQLTQLKAALSGAGLNRKSHSKKEKKEFKKGGAREVDRAKTLARLEDIRRGLNKFDERETKHDVGGRQLKGVTGRPSSAKQAGLEQRKKSLLPEHELRHHRGTFIDRRFGESDPTMSLEDKMLERYTRERQRGQGRKGMFNLDDDEGELFGFDDGQALGGLTHGGRSVMDLPGDDFDAQGFGERDEEEAGGRGAIDRRQVMRTHFGGFQTGEGEEELPEKKKSKAEVMSEIIAKSKEHKYERQQQKDQDADIREQLDEDIDDLRALLDVSGTNGGPSRKRRGNDEEEDANYDQYVRELAYDARAKPKDRTKTEAELAVEEKERLEQAEAKRQRRMRGEVSDDDEDEDGGRGGKKKRRVDKARGDADDLDDDFEDELLGPGIVTREDIENGKFGGADTSEEDEDEEEGSEEDDDEEGSDDDSEGEEDEEDESDDESGRQKEALLDELEAMDGEADDDEEEAPILVKSTRRSRKGKSKEIPYTFPCPATIDEFEDILEDLEDDAVPTVVQRIRALHHPSLAERNKYKLQTFLGVLLDYILLLASRPSPPLSIVNAIHPHLVALVKLNPISAASLFTDKLSVLQKNLTRGLARGAANPSAKTYPGGPELVLLRILGMVWSTSDFSHPVVAPAMLLMGQYLSQSRIRTIRDVAAGLYLCDLIAQYESESKRIVPESLDFLANALLALLPRKKSASKNASFLNLIATDANLVISRSKDKSISPAISLFDILSDSAGENQAKIDVCAVAFRLMQKYSLLYGSNEAFLELFSPISKILDNVNTTVLPESLRALLDSTASALSRQLSFALAAREPLAMQSHKPVPIASRAPRFEDDFAPGRHYDPDVERNATQKLKAQYKKERKGAIKELRKDNRFLAGERAREQATKDKDYTARMRRVEGSIHVERAEEKSMQREKAREKRRAGRK